MGDSVRANIRLPAELMASTPIAGPLAELQGTLGHSFSEPALLAEALTHPSVGAVAGAIMADFDRLEFLGDRVLGLVVAAELCRRYPDAGSGELALRYNALVRREACARVAAAIGLGPYLRLAKGERATGGETKPAILADACESVIGALYVDGGLEVAERFINLHWAPAWEEQKDLAKDPKTMLQEWAHRERKAPPVYVLSGTDGPAHAPAFRVVVAVEGAGTAEGRGPTKRSAEQEAAASVLRAVGAIGG